MQNVITFGFGCILQKIRKSKHLTQEKLAEMIDINTRQMARIEAGQSFVTSSTIYKLCLALKVNPSDLFNFTINN